MGKKQISCFEKKLFNIVFYVVSFLWIRFSVRLPSDTIRSQKGAAILFIRSDFHCDFSVLCQQNSDVEWKYSVPTHLVIPGMLDIDAFSWMTYLMCEYWFQVPLNPYYPPGVPFPHFPAAHMNHPMYKAADIPGHQPPPSDEYPERPGQPECQHFVKSGFCKYRMKCRYHHPRSRQSAPPAAGLSPIGLPIKPVSSYPIVLHSRLRSGEPFQKNMILAKFILFLLCCFVAGSTCVHLLWTLWLLQVWASLHVQPPLQLRPSRAGSRTTPPWAVPYAWKLRLAGT